MSFSLRLPALTAFLAGVLVSTGWAQDGPNPQDVVINEIQYAPSPAQNEFVELYNRSARTVDLSALTLADSRDDPAAISDTPVLLPPGGYAVLVRDAALFASAFPDTDFVVPSRWNVLNNGGDVVTLSAGSIVIDRVPYEPSWGGSGGASLERIDPAGPSTSPTIFGSSVAPAGATPGRQNSLFAPDTSPPSVLFADVTAADTVLIAFDEPIALPASEDAFRLDDGTSAAFLQRVSASRIRTAFVQPIAGVRLHVNGIADLTGNVLADTSLLLGYSPTPSDIVISEIMFEPRADDFDGQPNQPEYIEFTNRSARGLSPRGLFWTDRPDETGVADTVRIPAPAAGALPPEGYAVVYAEPIDDLDVPRRDGTLAAAFPQTDLQQPETLLLPLDATSLGLRNTGDAVRVQAFDGALLDEVSYSPSWHAAALADTRGVALERISLTGSSTSAANWTSSVAPEGGTPGQPNSVQLSAEAQPESDLTVVPSPFSPDGDGFDDATRIRFSLSSDIASVRVRIYDARGRLVRTLEESRLVGRTGELIWDGLGDGGRPLRIGIYVVLLEALDTAGGRVVTMKRPVVLARPLN